MSFKDKSQSYIEFFFGPFHTVYFLILFANLNLPRIEAVHCTDDPFKH